MCFCYYLEAVMTTERWILQYLQGTN